MVAGEKSKKPKTDLKKDLVIKTRNYLLVAQIEKNKDKTITENQGYEETDTIIRQIRLVSPQNTGEYLTKYGVFSISSPFLHLSTPWL